MQTEAELNDAILKLTNTIRGTFPELLKYISETPVKINYTNNSEINTKALHDYYDSLKAVLLKYAPNHMDELLKK